MIDMQLLSDALLALGVLVGAAIVFSFTMLVAAALARRDRAAYAGVRRGLPPHGGSQRDLPLRPQPDADDARVLVLR